MLQSERQIHMDIWNKNRRARCLFKRRAYIPHKHEEILVMWQSQALERPQVPESESAIRMCMPIRNIVLITSVFSLGTLVALSVQDVQSSGNKAAAQYFFLASSFNVWPQACHPDAALNLESAVSWCSSLQYPTCLANNLYSCSKGE